MRRLVLVGCLCVSGCASVAAPGADDGAARIAPSGVATAATAAANDAVAGRLPLDDTADFEDASRGLIAQITEDRILNPDGSVAWDVTAYAFLDGEPPATANPSLWRQGRLNALHGLFEVTDGIWQIRGYDLAVMTLIRGERGWIVVDPLTSAAPAAAGLALANRTLGERPVSAIIYTHSHGDHFGGVRGIVSAREVAERGIAVLAPAGFTGEAVSENLLAGNYMARRSGFQFGTRVAPGPAGHLGTGLGQRLSTGEIGLILPNREIAPHGETLLVDGVRFEFLDAAHTEAPAELVFYLPDFRALCSAEVVTRTLHNVLTPRGAKVRDSLRWSQVIDRMLTDFGDRADVLFASHHWPTWGGDRIRELLRHQRDAYRYTHDQTLRLANHGETAVEIAERLAASESAAAEVAEQDFSVRGYYGTQNHNAKAVFQHYFGWWDGVPANYHRLPPVEESTRYVAFMGGPEATLAKAIDAFEAGDYRWAATVFNHLVFADPEDTGAKQWLAASYEQLGFQAESGAWRNYYLTGAQELRDGVPAGSGTPSANPGFLGAVPTRALFDSLAARFDPARYAHPPALLEFRFPDRDEFVTVDITGRVAFPREGRAGTPDTAIELDRVLFDRLLLDPSSFQERVAAGEIRIAGDRAAAAAYLGALDRFPAAFNVVTP